MRSARGSKGTIINPRLDEAVRGLIEATKDSAEPEVQECRQAVIDELGD